MSSQDDSCKSLIEAIKIVFSGCGVKYYHPKKTHFASQTDFSVNADDVFNDLRDKARSR